jgi:hypothetical protein
LSRLIRFSPSSLGYQPEACFDRPMDNQLFPGPDAIPLKKPVQI